MLKPYALLALALTTPLAAAQDAPDAPAVPDQATLEARFAELLTDCRLVGSFTLDGAPERTPTPETYVIREAVKVADGLWRITAVVSFGKGELPFSMEVGVEWAGDTPMIQLTKKVIPLMGRYSARVIFYEDRYAGTWSGDGYGGHLFGYVRRGADEEGTSEEGAVEAGGGGAAEENRNLLEGGSGVNWPSFRGTRASGVAEGYPTPTTWNVETGENVRWRQPIPGLAHSSPVVWGDRIYLTTAVKLEGGDAELKVGLYGNIAPVPDEGPHRFQVLCLDKATGKTLWERTAIEAVPAIKRHTKGSHAASTPTTNGAYVVACFGSEGLYCYDRDGELVWKKDLGVLDSGYYVDPSAQWGFASSPVIEGDRVLFQCDVQGDSYIAAFRLSDGAELWSTPRDEDPSWGSPTVDPELGRVYVNGYRQIAAYDLETGAEVWIMEGGGDIPVPTPVLGHSMVYITNAHGRMAPILAVAADAEGLLAMDPAEEKGVLWWDPRGGNYMQTPIVVGDYIYLCHDGGILRCRDARTGEELYSERLTAGGGGFTGSAVAADGKLYCTSEDGEVFVVRLGPEFEVLAVNDNGETFMSTPAVSEGTILFRGRGHLLAVGGE